MRAIELFCCSGGMALGFQRAGITFAEAFDFDTDACDSYQTNLGHRPIQIDVRDLVRMARAGWSPGALDFLCADPPCTPWSRAGKRQGLADERDMLRETCDMIALLRPRCWLIGNVPGLDDSTNSVAVDSTIGRLALEHGYHVDYARLDAADFGVPQHRVRPFWFGHPIGSQCLLWPERTHGSSEECAQLRIGMPPLKPWVTCRDALSHLPIEELGRPVRVRWKRGTDHKTATPDAPAPTQTRNTHGDGALLSRSRGSNGRQLGSIPDRPARVVGTSTLSDGNLLVDPEEALPKRKRPFSNPQPPSEPSQPARCITTVERAGHGGGGNVLVADTDGHPQARPDKPSPTIRSGGSGHSAPHTMLLAHERHPISAPDSPAYTITTKGDDRGAQGGGVLHWPWDRPATTIQADERIAAPGHHGDSFMSDANAVVLSERARAILQGFPENWFFAGKTKASRSGQIGMAMPPPSRRGGSAQHRRVVRGCWKNGGRMTKPRAFHFMGRLLRPSGPNYWSTVGDGKLPTIALGLSDTANWFSRAKFPGTGVEVGRCLEPSRQAALQGLRQDLRSLFNDLASLEILPGTQLALKDKPGRRRRKR